MTPLASHPISSDTGKIILVVDDNAENLYAIGSLLEPHYRVKVAKSGAVAIESARRAPIPDLILLDIMMPEIDGYAVLRELRACHETKDIPVIFVTAMDTDADEAYGLSLGAADYLTKPIVPALLLARVSTQLALKEARDWLKDRNAVLATEVARQVEELKAAAHAARVASKAKSQFIDNMSHELRTPMNGVIGMLQLAQMELPPNHPVSEYLQVALKSSQTIVDLLGAILEYASIANSDIELQKRGFDVADVVDQVWSAWRRPVEEKGVRLVLTKRPGSSATMNGDEARLQRVLNILLGNALKFTATGEIELGLDNGASGLHLWVRDTGIGIPTDKLDKIFLPFEQADNTHTRQYGGAGLGLAIANHLVEMMGGRLSADSALGKGSTFHVTLPEH